MNVQVYGTRAPVHGEHCGLDIFANTEPPASKLGALDC